MAVRRIVPNLPSRDPQASAEFYRAVFELTVPMDMGWITFLGSDVAQKVELHTATAGGSGTDLPAISIEVDDFDATLARARAAGAHPVYGPVDEPWGVRRFYLRDPDNNLINIVTHLEG